MNNSQLKELRRKLFIALIIVDIDSVSEQPHGYIKINECHEDLIELNISFNIDVSDIEIDFYSREIIRELRHQEVSIYHTKELAYDYSIKQ
ncbi:hypothetical protein [Flammeovirga kamogawensis]|uniref:Uncharacterized protein n=1 Tax=Flammeovirga kamogawensis TaxID=373891 RepID=A0ABX8H361_9BACT|nr:hypothetical protein [Flammeovirga kamogawensis]MBB6460451.1 hypothetical protein [Flammeovirga kamogawensis]QWG10256.1 hypothetical protein KM029_21475 [Flammeovirga kamogawensis]TRX64705.1 hypothetical protein EO216_19400 [Flammeovirga kamogawensis]